LDGQVTEETLNFAVGLIGTSAAEGLLRNVLFVKQTDTSENRRDLGFSRKKAGALSSPVCPRLRRSAGL